MSTTKKSTWPKSSAKAASSNKPGAKKSAKRKYGPAASKKVGEVLGEMEAGTLRSGGSGEKVTDRKQAIAIGLSEARRSGAKVPEPPKS